MSLKLMTAVALLATTALVACGPERVQRTTTEETVTTQPALGPAQQTTTTTTTRKVIP